ncbi:MAG: macro domain-containing protein [Acidobacteria bacterium]|nr:macro domain-containing protein [Acidobacteriota bacterium]
MRTERKFDGKTLELWKGDITELEVDAIVNAANNHLRMGAGVAGAIKKKGGRQIESEAVAKGPIRIGGAVETGAGNLKARYVIHGAVMGLDFQTDARKISDATVSSLEVAERLGLRSVAFPAFGTGVGGFPLERCAELMLNIVVDRFLNRPGSLQRVIFALWDEEGFLAFQKVLQEQKSR